MTEAYDIPADQSKGNKVMTGTEIIIFTKVQAS
jgi:hypothetical protein